MPLVLDASMASTWCFPDEAGADTDSVLHLVSDDGARVPAIWPLEIANVLLLGERRQRLTSDLRARAIDLLCSLPIVVAEMPVPHALGTVFDLAGVHGLTTYDAAYLDLAMRERLPLATLDARLRAAATRVGVSLVQ